MLRTQRTLALLLAGLVVTLTGCGASSGPEPISDPRPTTTTTEPVEPTDADADEVVWQEFTGGGFVPMEYAASEVPTTTIYADGRIIVTAPAEGEVDGLRPLELLQAQIPADELDGFLTAAADTGLFEPGTDFGDPSITDMPSTTVTLRVGGEPQAVSVYALDVGLDPEIGGVTAEQAARRDQLNDLLDQARALADDPEPYVPEQVRATMFPVTTQIDPSTAPADWPGPPLDAFPDPATTGSGMSCLVIEGPDAAAVLEAGAANPGGFWTIDGEVRSIVLAPILPGQEGCPPA